MTLTTANYLTPGSRWIYPYAAISEMIVIDRIEGEDEEAMVHGTVTQSHTRSRKGTEITVPVADLVGAGRIVR